MHAQRSMAYAETEYGAEAEHVGFQQSVSMCGETPFSSNCLFLILLANGSRSMASLLLTRPAGLLQGRQAFSGPKRANICAPVHAQRAASKVGQAQKNNDEGELDVMALGKYAGMYISNNGLHVHMCITGSDWILHG